MRSPSVSRLYLQCAPAEDVSLWPDARIWEELHTRFASDGWRLAEGPITQKGVTGMRSFVVEPMQFGKLFLRRRRRAYRPADRRQGAESGGGRCARAGESVGGFLRDRKGADLLDRYSETCLRRVWQVQRFSGG